jgi:hypothetical protein
MLMVHKFAEIAFTPMVRAIQVNEGIRHILNSPAEPETGLLNYLTFLQNSIIMTLEILYSGSCNHD